MSIFLALAATLLLFTLAILLWPLLRRSPEQQDLSRQQLNAALYRDQFAELDRDRASGALSEDDYAQARTELQRRLLEDSATRPDDPTVLVQGSPQPRRNKLLPILLALFVSLGAAGLYVAIGSPAAVTGVQNAQRFKKEDVERMVAEFATKLESQPENYEGWAMLGRSYKMMRRFPEAIRAYERSGPLLESSPEVLVDYADAIAAEARGFNEKAVQLIDRALKLDPNNLQALWMRGAAAFDAQQYDQAVNHWEKLLTMIEPNSEEAGTIRGNLEEARKLGGKGVSTARPAGSAAKADKNAAASAGKIEGRVTLAPALAERVSAGATLMIIARPADGSRMPVAVLRVPVKDLPASFTLDDSASMLPDQPLSKHSELRLEARISKSGQAKTEPGDLYTQGVSTKPGARNIELHIDQVMQ